MKTAIEEIEEALGLQVVSNLKQLKGGSDYFRVRIGEYRIGLKQEGDIVVFVRFLHRKEIYRFFSVIGLSRLFDPVVSKIFGNSAPVDSVLRALIAAMPKSVRTKSSPKPLRE